MRHRPLGRTGLQVSEVGFGAWGIGGADFGPTDDAESMAALHAAVDAGITFVDTADVYGPDGHSERLVGRLLAERDERIVVATKIGRRGPLEVAAYTAENLRGWADDSRRHLGVETIDLVQLHSLPWQTYYTPEVFAAMDGLVEAGLIAHYGVSVERVEEALKAIEYPGVQTVQIILNIFRQRPLEHFLGEAERRGVGVIARVPLASGLLTGKLRPDTEFDALDHRRFNRHGEQFDVGETFSGVDYATGLAAVEEIRPLVPEGTSMAQLALRWVLDQLGVSTVIPGARTPEQARANAAASELPPLSPATRERLAEIYRERIAPQVHQRW